MHGPALGAPSAFGLIRKKARACASQIDLVMDHKRQILSACCALRTPGQDPRLRFWEIFIPHFLTVSFPSVRMVNDSDQSSVMTSQNYGTIFLKTAVPRRLGRSSRRAR